MPPHPAVSLGRGLGREHWPAAVLSVQQAHLPVPSLSTPVNLQIPESLQSLSVGCLPCLGPSVKTLH